VPVPKKADPFREGREKVTLKKRGRRHPRRGKKKSPRLRSGKKERGFQSSLCESTEVLVDIRADSKVRKKIPLNFPGGGRTREARVVRVWEAWIISLS